MKIEGRNAVAEAIREGRLDCLYVENGTKHPVVNMALENGIKVRYVNRNVLDKESETGRHQGFVGVTRDFEYCDTDDILALAKESKEEPLIVVLDGIEDPHNLGSIIRSAECAGVHGIVIPKNRSAQVNETVIRCSAGAAVHMKIARVTNINSAIEELKEKGVWTYAADMDGQCVYDADLSGGTAFVIGSEGFGVKRLTRELCDGVVSLPVRGQVNSLNASVACGILVYEAVRRRRG